MEKSRKDCKNILNGPADPVARILANPGTNIVLIGLITAEDAGALKTIREAKPLTDRAANMPHPERIHFGPWIMDRSRIEVLDSRGHSARLTTREFRILEALVLRPHRVLSREQLCDIVCGYNHDSYDRAIDVQITRIRNKLGDAARNARFIKTVRGAGYVFVGETEIIQ